MTQRILLVQLRQLGDILLTTPCLSALRQAYPQAEIVFLSHPMGRLILKDNPHLNELVTYDPESGWRAEWALARQLRARRFDLVFDFMNNPRSAFYTGMTGAACRLGFASARSWAYTQAPRKPRTEDYIVRHKFLLLQAAGVASGSEQLILPWPAAAADYVADFLAATPALKAAPLRILISPTHRRPLRRWPLVHYAALADRLSNEWGAAVVWLHGPGEAAVIDEVHGLCRQPSYKAPPTSFAQMSALMANMHLFIGNSNGPSHVAVAANLPSLQLHGHTSAVAWCPMNERHQALQTPEYGQVSVPRIEALTLEVVWSKLLSMRPTLERIANARPKDALRRDWQERS